MSRLVFQCLQTIAVIKSDDLNFKYTKTTSVNNGYKLKLSLRCSPHAPGFQSVSSCGETLFMQLGSNFAMVLRVS
jgi:hypothetical protein